MDSMQLQWQWTLCSDIDTFAVDYMNVSYAVAMKKGQSHSFRKTSPFEELKMDRGANITDVKKLFERNSVQDLSNYLSKEWG